MAGPAPLTTTALALAALLWAAPVPAAAAASAPHGAHFSGRPARTRQPQPPPHQPRRQAQEEGEETAGAGTTSTGIFSAAGLTDVDGQCRSSLYRSDADGDGRIDRDEYAAFANAISGGYFTASACTTNKNNGKVKKCAFDLLPLALQSNFINLACLCERFQFGAGDGEADGCCVGDNAHISAAGAGPDEEPTGGEALYLLTVCRETYTAVEEVRTEAPTEAPTDQPTESPTKAPTSEPTASPTAAPTASPTAVPTKRPTARPTRAPTARITDGPTAGPTEMEAAPTVPTIPTPTAAPTAAPTPPSPSAPTTAAPTAPTIITGPLPVSFGYAISNLQGYDAADIVADPPAGGNAIAADLRGALGTILVPAVVAETFGSGSDGGGEGARRKQRQRRLGEQPHNEVPSSPSQLKGGGVTQEMMLMMTTKTMTSSGRRRRLLVQYDPEVDPAPTVDSVVDIDCPAGAPPDSSCQSATSTAILQLTDEDPAAVTDAFAAAMAEAIAAGRLDDALRRYNPATEIASAGPPPAGVGPGPSPPPSPEAKGLGGGAIAGIALGGVAAVGLIAALLVKSRGGSGGGPAKDVRELGDVDVVGEDLAAGGGGGGGSTLGATQPMYGKKSKIQKRPLDDSMEADEEMPASVSSTSLLAGRMPDEDMPASVSSTSLLAGHMPDEEMPASVSSTSLLAGQMPPAAGDGGMGAGAAAGVAAGAVVGAAALGAAAIATAKRDDDDSSAGSSGWSSASGKSSLDSDHEGDADDNMLGIGAGAGSSAASQQKVDAIPGGVAKEPASRDDLDTAIESGDWAAVGATAALLASASDSASHASSHRSRSTKSSVSSLDAARAAELDQLVDAGDWEGVVLTAAKFEAESSTKSGSGSAEPSSGSRSDSRSVGTSSAYTQSTAGVSESASKVARREEIRTEVEALVRRVVPDEIDNVDEMMKQFRGREEELVETLRTMQERSVAQRARAAVHKSAKIQARRSVKQKRAAAAAAGVAAGTAAGIAMSKSKSGEKEHHDSTTADQSSAMLYPDGKPARKRSTASRKEPRTALEAAIEAGDWEAVGEAAALMSDADSQSYADSLPSGVTGSSKGRSVGSAADAGRAAELDKLIDKGDWQGVVTAASRYSTLDKASSSSSTGKKKAKLGSSESEAGSGGSNGGMWRKKIFGKKGGKGGGSSEEMLQKEEEEARAQAAIWENIAAQSKSSLSGQAAAASDAADWAISRSLTALKKAEKTSKDAPGTSSGEV